ncbi:MAG: hypothetical protein HQK92_01545 [Nitrospirae bacterium]|nr:hypothetical protein [Nitrospirota bacterium]
MSVNSIGGGMPRVTSGASSKVKSQAQNVQSKSTQQTAPKSITTPAQTLAKSLNLLDSLGKNTAENGKSGKSIDIYA